MSSISTSSSPDLHNLIFRLKCQLTCLLIGSLILPLHNVAQAAQWKLDKLDEQYQISIKSVQSDKLLLSHEGEDTRFILRASTNQIQPDAREKLQLWFDKDTAIIESALKKVDRYNYLIKLDVSQKNEVLNKMINGIEIHFRYPDNEQKYRDISFSLLGFTAVLNDLLIAHEIGHLDPEWLNENHKTQELMCYYAANFSVLAMLYRKQGMTERQSALKLKKEHTDVLDEIIHDIVRQVYTVPRSRLPRDPRGDKFGIFKRCMQAYQH